MTQRGRDVWIIDYGASMAEADAALYDGPFDHVRRNVYPERRNNKREAYRLKWWLHVEARTGMRKAVDRLPRYIVIPRAAKHLLFTWMTAPTLADCQLIAIGRSDD